VNDVLFENGRLGIQVRHGAAVDDTATQPVFHDSVYLFHFTGLCFKMKTNNIQGLMAITGSWGWLSYRADDGRSPIDRRKNTKKVGTGVTCNGTVVTSVHTLVTYDAFFNICLKTFDERPKPKSQNRVGINKKIIV
jgi:hypothetical protein